MGKSRQQEGDMNDKILSLLLHAAFHSSLGASTSLPLEACVLQTATELASAHTRSQVPQLPPASPTLAQQASANPFCTACLSFSARGRLRRLAPHTHTPFPRQRDPRQPQEAPAPNPRTRLSYRIPQVFSLLVCLLGCHNSPNLPIS